MAYLGSGVDRNSSLWRETMSVLVTLIGIAAWCGQPSTVLSAHSVNQCRIEIWQCLQTMPHNSKCFTEYKLDEPQTMTINFGGK